MVKAVQDFLFGLFFGMGFAIANNILNLLGSLLHGH